jgi:hypothetical protein
MSGPAIPSLFTVLARVGLKLETGEAKVDVFVIEHIQQPIETDLSEIPTLPPWQADCTSSRVHDHFA